MKRTLTLAACTALALATTPLRATDLSNMTAAEQQAFGKAVRSYVLENPELIMEAVSILREREAQAEARADFDLVTVNAQDIFEDGFSYVGGNPDGDITLVEFMDYRCGYCRKAYDDVEELIASDGNIRLIVKEFPILGDASMASSQFAIAIKQLHGAVAYKKTHDALIALNGEPNEPTLIRLATSLGHDAGEIMERMDSDDVLMEIATTRALAQRLQITGTPTFVLQDELVRGYVPLDAMRELVSDKRG